MVYGRGNERVRRCRSTPRALERVLHASGSGINTLIDLTVGSRPTVVLVKELQREPEKGLYIHADLYEVDLKKAIEVGVPLHFVGKAAGLEEGGVLDHPMREIQLECLPREIPDHIEVDVSALNIGESLHVRDIAIEEGMRMLSDPDLAVASVVAPRAEEEETPAEGEEEAAAAEGEGAEGAETADGEKASAEAQAEGKSDGD